MTHIKEKKKEILKILKDGRRLLMVGFKESPFLTISLFTTAIITSIIPFLQSGIIAIIINRLASSENANSYIGVWISLLVAITVLPTFISSVHDYFDKRYWYAIQNFFELNFSRKISNLSISRLENPKMQDVIQRVDENFYTIPNFLGSQFDLVRNIIGLSVASSILFIFNPWVFAVIIIGAIPGFYIELRYGRGEWGVWGAKAEERRRYWDLRRRSRAIEEITEMKIFQNTEIFYEKMKKLLVDFTRAQISNETKRFVGNILVSVTSSISIGFGIFWAIQEVTQGTINIGTMTFVLYSISNFSTSFTAFLFTIARQFKFGLYIGDAFYILDQKNSEQKYSQQNKRQEETPEIIFENVSFKYPETNNFILKNFSLTIKPNERLALVGINGSGKTTVVKLLCSFYYPTEGKILIDGIDLKEIDPKDWYKKLAVLFQDYATYNFLVKEGIALGDSSRKMDIEEITKSAILSDADTFIKEWKSKYDQMIGKEFTDGVEPSKGQRQKLALARSFYRKPKILILDEPTASVDAEAEAKIFEGLESLPKNQTMILISHRFSTVRNADRICVIKDGSASEVGSHEELLALNGTYAKLFISQARGYK